MMLKNKITVFLVVMISLSAGVAPAFAADLNFSADTNVVVNSLTLKVLTGSVATAPFVTGSPTLSVIVPAGTFTLQSPDGYTLTNNGTGTTPTCEGVGNTAPSQVIVTGSQTVLFSPTSVIACTGVVSPTPAPVEDAGPSRVIGSSGNNVINVPNPGQSGTGSVTVAADGQVLCPNGMTLLSNCSVAPVFGAGICPNGMTVSTNCTLAVGTPTVINVPLPALIIYDFGLATIRQGSFGDACRNWQSFFNNRANAGLALDGRCGPLTMAAARVWQASSGLAADGLLGPMSRAEAYRQAATR